MATVTILEIPILKVYYAIKVRSHNMTSYPLRFASDKFTGGMRKEKRKKERINNDERTKPNKRISLSSIYMVVDKPTDSTFIDSRQVTTSIH